MVRQKRKEENREGGREKVKVESDGVLQAGGVILRHWHKQLLYCKSLEVRLPFIYSRTWLNPATTGNEYLAMLRQYYVTCFIIVGNYATSSLSVMMSSDTRYQMWEGMSIKNIDFEFFITIILLALQSGRKDDKNISVCLSVVHTSFALMTTYTQADP